MKQIEKFFSHACMYTVCISMAFYIFSEAVNTTGLSMTFARFFTVFAFSLVISSMEYVFTVTKVPVALQYIIHYVTLCVSFGVVFLTIRKTNADFVFSASSVFAAIVLFSFGYALFFLSRFIIRKLAVKVEKKCVKSAPASTEYKSRFK